MAIETKNWLWALEEADDPAYARVTFEATWPKTFGEEFILPRVIEWEPGADQIGDFVSVTGALILRRELAEELQKQFGGFEIETIGMHQRKGLKAPTRQNRRTKPRVWLPYDGPPLCVLRVTQGVVADAEKSTLKYCGHDELVGEIYDLQGVGYYISNNDKYSLTSPNAYFLRTNNNGIFVPKSQISKSGLIFCKGIKGKFICTDDFRKYIQKKNYSNILFSEIGEAF